MQDSQSKPSDKRFTREEANAMLPLVRSIASDIRDIFRRVTGRRSDLHRLLRRGSLSAGTQYDAEVNESRADLKEEYEKIWQFREELESLGVSLRNPESGAIEFPATIMGRDAFYCWEIGESEVHFWRDATSPNAPKQSLPQLQRN